jgi:pilus assembly protein CpaF
MLESLLPPPDQTRVLIVEDYASDLELIRTSLKPTGYSILSAVSGEEALERIARVNPHVVLLDVGLPGMDGFEVCRRIKADPSTLFLPVIMITGLKENEDKVKGAEAGADDFLTKPSDRQELLARVRTLVSMKAMHDALEENNRKLRLTVKERTRQLEQATQELQALLRQKAQFSPDVIPPPPQVPKRRDEHIATAPPADAEPEQESLQGFKQTLMSRLCEALDGRTLLHKTPDVVDMLSERLAAIYEMSGLGLDEETRGQLFRDIVDEIIGYGPIEPLLADPTISEVMVNGPSLVYIERDGRISKTDAQFDDDSHLLRLIERMVRPLGRRIDHDSPAVDARLPDGSRINAIIPPCAIDGPSLTIRKFSKDKLTVEDLVRYGTITPEVAEFLEACVCSRINIIVAGGTGSGKTTLLNVLSSFIPEEERIVTIEDSAELQLDQEHVVRLEYKPPDREGKGEMSIRSLVRNSLRMRPDRIVIGEVRGGEALDMLQAMNTGHDGSLTTLHANSPRDSLARLETMVLMAGIDLPVQAIRSQIASAIDLIIQVARFRDGSRKVTHVSELEGMGGEIPILSEIFTFEEEPAQDGRAVGQLKTTGIRPKLYSRLEIAGFKLPPGTFMTESNSWRSNR